MNSVTADTFDSRELEVVHEQCLLGFLAHSGKELYTKRLWRLLRTLA